MCVLINDLCKILTKPCCIFYINISIKWICFKLYPQCSDGDNTGHGGFSMKSLNICHYCSQGNYVAI